MYFLDGSADLYGSIEYDFELSIDYNLFGLGISLQGLSGECIYNVKNKKKLDTIMSQHVIDCLGPTLVSENFRKIIELIAPNEIEFFEAKLLCKNKEYKGFYVINVPIKKDCCDMKSSEWKLTNFDPQSPEYMFYYRVVFPNATDNYNFIRCAQSKRIVVSQKIKDACFNSNLRGILFCTSIDLTYADRSICYES